MSSKKPQFDRINNSLPKRIVDWDPVREIVFSAVQEKEFGCKKIDFQIGVLVIPPPPSGVDPQLWYSENREAYLKKIPHKISELNGMITNYNKPTVLDDETLCFILRQKQANELRLIRFHRRLDNITAVKKLVQICNKSLFPPVVALQLLESFAVQPMGGNGLRIGFIGKLWDQGTKLHPNKRMLVASITGKGLFICNESADYGFPPDWAFAIH